MNNGQMDNGNENPTQHFLWWLTEAIKNPNQVGWDRDLNSGSPKFDSSVLPLCHLTRWRSFCFGEYHHVKDFAASVLKGKISSLMFFIFTVI